MRLKVILSFFAILWLMFSCTFTKNIKDGTMAFELKQYSVAAQLLSEEYQTLNDERSRARIAYLLGESYWNMGEIDLALPWYDKAVANKFGPKALEKKAFSLKQIEQYVQAVLAFEILLRDSPQNQEYRGQVAICKLAEKWSSEKNKPFVIEKAYFNSRQSDYSPAFRDNQQIFFSSDRIGTSNTETYNWTGRSFSDIYVYDILSGQVSHFDPTINSESNEGTLCFSGDGTRVFFTRCISDEEYDDFCKILFSDFVDGAWTNPKKLPFIQDEINYGHPFWSEEKRVLFFSSEQQSGYGGFDIYFSRLDSNQLWSQPIALPENINTIRDEKFPSLKNDTLFFASDGHLGMGGLDIFSSFIDKNGSWTRPSNLKSPINSGYDDFGIIFEPFEGNFLNQGYFTSSRNGGDDIYKFSENLEKETETEIVEETPTNSKKQLKLAITVLIEDESGNKTPQPKASVLINRKQTKLNSKAFSYKDISPIRYDIQVSYPGYFSTTKTFDATLNDIPGSKDIFTYNKTIILKPIVENKEIVLENILYDFNKSFIRDDAKPSLIELAGILKSNPEIIIELSSHTDCRGPDAYNENLSQQRAEAAVEYIINLGIETNRITAKGYGEKRPKTSCACDSCSEEEHQLNRRTSFKIIGVK